MNDVAAVNIDAKLVRRSELASASAAGPGGADFDSVELDNGCVCCSAGDDLFQAISKLLGLAKRRGYAYSRIVVESSGVAEPQNLRDRFQELDLLQLPLARRARMDHMVTVVDSGAFFKTLHSTERLNQRPDLGSGGGRQPVADLLIEQVEFADAVVLNKADTLDETDMAKLEELVRSLNPLARIVTATFGNAPLWSLQGNPNNEASMAKLSVEGQVRGAVAAVKAKESKHGHGHADDHGDGHGHAHDHGDGHEHGPECGHGHSHGDGHVHGPECGHHSHDHDLSDDRQDTTAARRFGIRSFVYSARKPFNVDRLKIFSKEHFGATVMSSGSADKGGNGGSENSPVRKVLRSKGFVWLSAAHGCAWYWSHAASAFEILDEGDWWCAIPDEEWPELQEQRKALLADFEGPWGDRRQEIVFIGIDMDEPAIVALLDQCLCSDAEMEKYAEDSKMDPDPEHADDWLGKAHTEVAGRAD